VHYSCREIEGTPADILKGSSAWEVVGEAPIVVQDKAIELYFYETFLKK
jgi:hypothetical protein